MPKKSYHAPRRYTTESFKERLKEVYGDRFCLDKVVYGGAYENITLVCPIHGDFTVRACSAARGDAVCRKCSSIQRSLKSRIPFEEVIDRIHELHPTLVIDPSQEYLGTHSKINVVCPKHGEFLMTPNSLLSGQRCPKCGKESMKEKNRHNLEWLIEKSKEIHGDKYTFEKFVFVNTKTKGIVTCRKHGDFEITPDKLIYAKRGCPNCSSSKLETSFKMLLEKNNEEFIWQYRPKWLNLQSLDFFLPKHNIAIECQGIQHYSPTRFGGISEEEAIKRLDYVKELDNRKKLLCEENNINVLYLRYDDDINSFYEFLKRKIIDNR